MFEIEKEPSPHQSSRKGAEINLIVVHADASPSEGATINWLRHPDSEVSYHYLIGRDGKVSQFVDEYRKAWGAGVSEWTADCTVGNSVNPHALNVAFSNAGPGKEELYTEQQYHRAGELLYQLMLRHNVPLHRIRGHDEVSPGRKTDPYSYFKWSKLYESIGLAARELKA